MKRKISLLAVSVTVLFTLGWLWKQFGATFESTKNPIWSGFRSGEAYVYRLNMQSNSTFDIGLMLFPTMTDKKSNLPRNSFNLSIIDGRLELDVIRKSRAGLQLSVALDDFSMTVESPLVKGLGIDKLKEEMRSPFLLDINEDGSIQTFYFSPNQSILAQNVLRQIAQQLLPTHDRGEYWEESVQGQSLVFYEAPDEIRLNKIFRDHRIKGSFVQPAITGSIAYRFEPKSHILSEIKGKRILKAEKAGQLHFNDRLDLALVFLDKKPSSRGWISSVQMRLEGQKAYADAREQLQALEMELNQKTVGKQTFQDLVKELHHSASKLAAADQIDMYRKLKAHLALDPGLIDEFKSLIQQFGSDDPRFDMLVTLLATQGSEAAQEALVDLMSDSFEDPRGLQNLGVHLALVEKPADVTLEFFIDKLDQLDPQSENFDLMLQLSGSLTYTGNQPSLDRKIYEILEDQFENPASSKLYDAATVGLANSGNSKNWQKAAPLLQDSEAASRGRGLSLLRLVQGEHASAVEQTFLSAVMQDADHTNRRDAAVYLSQRTVSTETVRGLAEAFTKEKDSSVATTILDAIARRPEDPRQAAETLKELNKQCGSPEICSKAEALLLSLLSS